MSRCRLALIVGCACLTITMAGCSDALNAGPLEYVENEALTKDLEGKRRISPASPSSRTRSARRSASFSAIRLSEIRVPEGSGLTAGGLYLANFMQEGEGADAKYYRYRDRAACPQSRRTIATCGRKTGGYALYRRNCLHCHGVSGAGDGPTAPFLYPPPRDYRKGIFKFTSTPSGAPRIATISAGRSSNGLHGTSMPAFDSLHDRGRDRAGHRLRDVPEHARARPSWP